MTPSSRPRRRLSRRVPFYVPAVVVFGTLLLLLVVAQGVRAISRPVPGAASAPSPAAEGPPVTPSPAPTSPMATATTALAATVAPATAVVSSGTLPGADPLAEPSLDSSPLDDEALMTFLVLGTDGRELEDGPPRTDLIMVGVADRARQRLTLISIPRDLWVPIPGYGEGKANTAYFLGALEGDGVSLAKETVEGIVGFALDYFVTVDFDGFRTVVDEMGGITVDVPDPIDDPDYPDENYGTFRLQIPAGEQQMDGETALRYARTRYGGTDMDRADRQQRVLLAVREKAMQPQQLALAPVLLRTLYREVESNLSLADFFALARFGRELERENIHLHTINGDLTQPVITWNGQDALLYDPASVQAQISDWLSGH